MMSASGSRVKRERRQAKEGGAGGSRKERGAASRGKTVKGRRAGKLHMKNKCSNNIAKM
jgi:hypothetical protein